MSTILIAYEREMEQNALEKILSARGHTVLRSNNGVEALETARRETPNLIISDILLPKMDGFALLKKWKQDDHLQGVPFVFYTRRHDDPKYARFALELGSDRYVERSNDPGELYKAVDEMLAEGAMVRHADTMRLQALSTGSFTATTRIAAVETAIAEHLPAKEKGNGHDATASTAIPSAVNPSAATQTDESSATQASGTGESAVARESRLVARIAELDALNKQLHASEERFRQLFEANPLPLWLLNADDRQCTAVNQAALTLYGYSRDEFLSLPRTASPFVPGAQIPGTNATWHRTKSGSAIGVELTARQFELGSRRCEIVCAHDVTQRVFSQQTAAQITDAYQALLVAAVDGMWLLDEQQKLIEVNQAYCRMSGYSREELLKLTPNDLEMRMADETTIRLHQRQMSEKSGQNIYESIHRRKDGSTFPVEVSVGGLTGARPRTVVVVRDATAQVAKQQAEQQHARAQTAALELLAQAGSLDEHSIVLRAVEIAANLTDSPLAFCAATDQSMPATLTLTAVYEQSRRVAVAANGAARKLNVQGPSAQCLRSGQPLIIVDPRRTEASPVLPQQQTMLLMPIISEEERLGVLSIANRSKAYAQHDQRVLAPFVTALASILQTKRNQAQTLITAQRADLALQGIIEGLSRVVERHDPRALGGPRRVASLAVAIARELDLTSDQQEALRTAGLLHGIGNVAVPSTLLGKPASLTSAEMALVRTHVEEGRKILSEIEFSQPVSDIVYQQHERMDGSGYPQGLRGDAIMIEARVLAVANVVEAMCASRPHRPAPGLDAALDEIERGADKLYDARVSAACLRLFREKGFTLPD